MVKEASKPPPVGKFISVIATLLTLFMTWQLAEITMLKFGPTGRVMAQVTEVSNRSIRYRFRIDESAKWYTYGDWPFRENIKRKVSKPVWNAAKASGVVEVTYSRTNPSINELSTEVDDEFRYGVVLAPILIAATIWFWRLSLTRPTTVVAGTARGSANEPTKSP